MDSVLQFLNNCLVAFIWFLMAPLWIIAIHLGEIFENNLTVEIISLVILAAYFFTLGYFTRYFFWKDKTAVSVILGGILTIQVLSTLIILIQVGINFL